MRQKAVPSMTTGRFLRPLIVPIIALSIVVAAVVAPASSVANCNPCLPPPNEWPHSSTTGSTPVTSPGNISVHFNCSQTPRPLEIRAFLS